MADFEVIFGQISLEIAEIDRFCTDQTSVFNVFLTEVIICSINNNTLQKWTNGNKPLTSWLEPSCCLHISATKFWHKFWSLRQVNTPSSWDKFQNCCTDMYLIIFLLNFAVFCIFLWISRDFADLPEFCGSATARNMIRSPGWGFEILFRTEKNPQLYTFPE